MKKTAVLLSCLVLLACLACTAVPSPGENPDQIVIATESAALPTPGQTESGEQTAAAQPGEPEQQTAQPTGAPGLPIVYNVYEEVGGNVSEAEMFRYDIDFDGKEEVVSFRIDIENDDTIIRIDEKEVLFDFSSQLIEVILIDLDPETPWVNLLVEIDFASDDYVTTEMHLENGEPVKGVQTEGVSVDENGGIVGYFRTDFLGTRSCRCTCSGEALTPDTVWLDCWYPSEQEIAEEFDELVEYYDLQITKREVPCTINGKTAKIAKNSYVYLKRINFRDGLAEICTVDGITAIVSYYEEEGGWGYQIDGLSQDEYFDNILYAD